MTRSEIAGYVLCAGGLLLGLVWWLRPISGWWGVLALLMFVAGWILIHPGMFEKGSDALDVAGAIGDLIDD